MALNTMEHGLLLTSLFIQALIGADARQARSWRSMIPASEQLQMYLWYNNSRTQTVKMDLLRHDFTLGSNFSFEDFVKIVGQMRNQRFWLSPAEEIPLIIAYVTIILFGLFANGLIVYVVLWKKKLKTVRNLFIVNLAVSDILMCSFCMPFTLQKLLLKNWMLGDAMCRLVPWLQAVNVFASTMTITAIALDRYQVIVCPSTLNENARRHTAFTIIVTIWFVSVLVGLPFVVYSKVEDKKYIEFVSYTMCLESWPSTASRLLYAAVISLLQFVIPISMLITIHWRLCNFLKGRLADNPANTNEMNRAMKEAKLHRKNSMLLMTIAIMFALCWFPLTLLNILADYDYHLFINQNFLLGFGAAHLLAMTSACLNPIMYGWFNSNFRREFTKVVCFWKFNVDPSPERVESRHLVEQRVLYKRPISYKAIQTEVQIHLKPDENSYDIHLKGSSSSYGQCRRKSPF